MKRLWTMDGSHMLNTEVVLERRETRDDGMGGQVVDWNVHGFIPARISQPLDDSVRVAVQEEKRFTHRVYLRPGEDVQRGDQLVTGDGFAMRVEAVVDPSEPAYRRAECIFVQEGL